MDYNKIIGCNIKSERQLRNMTVEEFSKLIGIDAAVIELIESGRKSPGIKNLHKIAEFFSTSMDALLNRVPENTAEKSAAASGNEKRDAVKNLVDTLSESEVEFVSVTVSNLKKLRKPKTDR